jgi:hypothetical protein
MTLQVNYKFAARGQTPDSVKTIRYRKARLDVSIMASCGMKTLRSAALVLASNDLGGEKLQHYFRRPMTMVRAFSDGRTVDAHDIGCRNGTLPIADGQRIGQLFPRKFRRNGIEPASKELFQRWRRIRRRLVGPGTRSDNRKLTSFSGCQAHN